MPFTEYVIIFELKMKEQKTKKNERGTEQINNKNKVLHERQQIFNKKICIVNLHPTKGTHWDFEDVKKVFDSHGCPPLNVLSVFLV